MRRLVSTNWGAPIENGIERNILCLRRVIHKFLGRWIIRRPIVRATKPEKKKKQSKQTSGVSPSRPIENGRTCAEERIHGKNRGPRVGERRARRKTNERCLPETIEACVEQGLLAFYVTNP